MSGMSGRLRGFIRKGTALLLIAAVASFAAPETAHATIGAIREEITGQENEKGELEGKLEDTNNEINSLEGKKNTLQGELQSLNEQLTEVSDHLADLERQIADKEQEIADTQAALEAARIREAEQYASMRQNIRFMYERSDFSYLDALFSARNFADFLNLADYFEKISAYDERMFKEYEATREFIESEELRLQNEKTELDGLKVEAEAEKSRVSGLISQTSSRIGQYADQISEAERKALEYEAEIKKVEENLEVLKKRLAEEIAKSQQAANATWRDISEVSFADGDLKLLANLIYCEAGAEPYDGKLAVGAVVINRIRSAVFPDSMVGVIYQRSQFSPVGSGRLELALASDWANEDCYRAAQQAMSGMTNVGNCVFFRTPVPGLTGTAIGGHIFY